MSMRFSIFMALLGAILIISSIGGDSGASSRGIMVCSGSGDMFSETVTMIEQTRFKTNSTLPITVAHCNELSLSLIQILEQIPKVSVMNICQVQPSYQSFEHRIKGFFCKPAAVLVSPYTHTMIVDSDVIWFDNPDKLFESEAFKATGTLFFRDRWTRTKNRLTLTRGTQNPSHVLHYINSMRQTINYNKPVRPHHKPHPQHAHPPQQRRRLDEAVDVKQLATYNAYWHDFALGNKGSSLDHWQDSSVFLIDKARHPRMLHVLELMLRDYNIGYGDKEMYWIAATIADEPFQFEPHQAGALGDCGAIIHFLPSNATISSDWTTSSATPFYLNAEYLVDLSKLNAAGDFIALDGTDPHKAVISAPVPLHEATAKVYSLAPWKNMKHGFYPCSSCQHAKCSTAPKFIVDEIIQRQRFILALKAAGTLDLSKYTDVRNKFKDVIESPLVSSH